MDKRRESIFKLLDTHCIPVVSNAIKDYIEELSKASNSRITSIDLVDLLLGDTDVYLNEYLLTKNDKRKILYMFNIMFPDIMSKRKEVT